MKNSKALMHISLVAFIVTLILNFIDLTIHSDGMFKYYGLIIGFMLIIGAMIVKELEEIKESFKLQEQIDELKAKAKKLERK